MQVEQFSGSRDQWNAFVTANGGGVMQSDQWGAMRTDLGWRPERLVVLEKGTIQAAGLVLKKPLPLGYQMYYLPEGPVVTKDDWQDAANQRAVTALFSHLRAQAGQDKAILLKIDPHVRKQDFPLGWLQGQGFQDSPEDIQPAFVAHVDLTRSPDEILAGMKQKGRYNIRYAERKGVEVGVGTSEDDLNTWYELTRASAKRQGITYRSLDYFKTFRKHFMGDDPQACFIIARYEGKPAAAILLTTFGQKADYLYGGSSDADRNVFASYLVQWVGMQEAKKRGCAIYNMTGVAHTDDPKNPWHGLRRFKLKFGAEVVELIGAWDQVYRPTTYFAFTNADRARRLVAKTIGKARTQ